MLAKRFDVGETRRQQVGDSHHRWGLQPHAMRAEIEVRGTLFVDRFDACEKLTHQLDAVCFRQMEGFARDEIRKAFQSPSCLEYLPISHASFDIVHFRLKDHRADIRIPVVQVRDDLAFPAGYLVSAGLGLEASFQL